MMRFNPPFYFMISIAIAIVFHFLLPLSQPIEGPYRWSGLVLVVLGGWLTVWADAAFKKVGTTVKPGESPTVLVSSGPFKLSRHPMYLGMVGASVGVAIVLGSVTSGVGPILFWGIIQSVFIPHEEKAMLSSFGGAYTEYCRQTRRWV